MSKAEEQILNCRASARKWAGDQDSSIVELVFYCFRDPGTTAQVLLHLERVQHKELSKFQSFYGNDCELSQIVNNQICRE